MFRTRLPGKLGHAAGTYGDISVSEPPVAAVPSPLQVSSGLLLPPAHLSMLRFSVSSSRSEVMFCNSLYLLQALQLAVSRGAPAQRNQQPAQQCGAQAAGPAVCEVPGDCHIWGEGWAAGASPGGKHRICSCSCCSSTVVCLQSSQSEYARKSSLQDFVADFLPCGLLRFWGAAESAARVLPLQPRGQGTMRKCITLAQFHCAIQQRMGIILLGDVPHI